MRLLSFHTSALPMLALLSACNGTPAKDSGKDDSGTTGNADSGEPDDSATDDSATDDSAGGDADGDGYTVEGGDCDDGDGAVNPGATEVCDGVDNDCNGGTDDDATDAVMWYADADGDGWGDAATGVAACEVPAGYTQDSTDCDDSDGAVNPGATEVCDGADNDCDGLSDDLDDAVSGAPTWYSDGDGDGYGDAAAGTVACEAPAGTVADATDCDDGDAAYNPGADESDCTDPNDYNCDGSVGYADADGDGFAACVDCDDGAAGSYPGADEYCDGADNDCDGTADEDALDQATWYADGDGDGYGDAGVVALGCGQPAGHVADATDCDDGRAESNPAGTELCNGLDDNCDGQTDEDASADAATWYADGDGDGYGDAGATTAACAQPAGYVADASDCADGDGAINPAAREVCDAGLVDEDCDGASDDSDVSVDAATFSTFYADADGDGYGDPAAGRGMCRAAAGYVPDATDCDDGAAGVNPGSQEICDALDVDEDCDGASDDSDASVDAATYATWYTDGDQDGWGSDMHMSCELPAIHALQGGDCADGDAAINPAAQEVCDTADTDEDCDGASDDADLSVDAATYDDWYLDNDGDGYGTGAALMRCDQPAGYAGVASDCDDGDGAINPAAQEVCDAGDVDEDCDGLSDDGDLSVDVTTMTSFYADDDGDGYGDMWDWDVFCDASLAYVADSTDCDDTRADVNPGATEVCDAADTDEDCDGASDDADLSTDPGGKSAWYADSDLDGYGSGLAEYYCDQFYGYVANATDCDDSRAAIHPGAQEICDSADRDEDCDGLADDGDASATGQSDWYRDGDGDRYGGTATTARACNQPTGYASGNNDCDDANVAVNPGMSEVCENGLDDNCSGVDDCRDQGLFVDALSADVTLNASNGSTAATFFGGSAARGGYDVTGDGYPELVIGDREYDASTAAVDANRGRAYVLRGGASGLQDTIASPRATLTGAGNGDRAGSGLSFVSDIDGDGDDELLVGAYLSNPTTPLTDAGAVYLLRGGAGLSGALVNTDAHIIIAGGTKYDYIGWTTTDGGDLTGDGVPDWAVGGYSPITAAGVTNNGTVLVVSGTAAGGRWSSTTTANNAATITGASSGDRIGASVLGDVDLDGDGTPELLVTSAALSTTWIFEAPLSGSLTQAAASATLTGHDIVASASNEVNCSPCLADAGDVDGDGRSDLLVGADGYDYGGFTNNGAAFLLHGEATLPSGNIAALSDAQIYGVFPSDVTGRAVSGGDVNGDDYGDLLVGASGFDNPLLGAASNTGVAAIFYGPVSGAISLSALPTAYAVYGSLTSSESLGAEAAFVGDLDADGFDDFFLGAPNYNPGTRAGRGFLYYGTGE